MGVWQSSMYVPATQNPLPEKNMVAASPSGNRLTAKYMATGSRPAITPETELYCNNPREVATSQQSTVWPLGAGPLSHLKQIFIVIIPEC